MILQITLITLSLLASIAMPAYASNMLSKDSSKPIEISADELEVKREQHMAVFTGKVEAIQGRVNLRSDKMVVHYRSPEEKKKAKKGTDNAVQKIEVFGNVLLTTPEESAKGNEGLYDVDSKKVTLTGNVIVTKGKNIVKGENLVYNLATGESQLKSGGAKSGQKKGGRVKGVFVPEGN